MIPPLYYPDKGFTKGGNKDKEFFKTPTGFIGAQPEHWMFIMAALADGRIDLNNAILSVMCENAYNEGRDEDFFRIRTELEKLT